MAGQRLLLLLLLQLLLFGWCCAASQWGCVCAQELLPLMLAGALSSSARFTVILRPSTTLLCRALITPFTTDPSLNSQKP